MNPGRELDKLIAEKVMGVSAMTNQHLDCPHYSTDIAAAWDVVEKLNSLDYAIILDNMTNSLGTWQAHFKKDRFSISITEGDSMPYVICLAALRVIEVKG